MTSKVTPVDPLSLLPCEIAIHIGKYLSIKDLAMCLRVNHYWNLTFSNDELWIDFTKKHIGMGGIEHSKVKELKYYKKKLDYIFKLTFHFPELNDYLLDETTRKIVVALQKRDWKVPGINFTFYRTNQLVDYSENVKINKVIFKHLETLNTKNFNLWFNRPQRDSPNQMSTTAAIHSIRIEKKELKLNNNKLETTFSVNKSNDSNLTQKYLGNKKQKLFSRLNETISYFFVENLPIKKCDPGAISQSEYFYTHETSNVLEDFKLKRFYMTKDIFNEFNEYLIEVLNKIERNESFE